MSMKKLGWASLFSTVAMLGAASSASAAGIIFSPVSAVINSGAPGFGNIADTYNQNGLSTSFISGVTDFDAYLALNPVHTNIFQGNEWFSNDPSNNAVVTYDLGSVLNIDRLALWNEESSGIGTLNLLYSTDNVNFSSLASGLTPFDNPLADYPAEVFSFASTSARYVRFEASGCPQPNPGSFNSCAIGEVAFSISAPREIPEPSGMIGTSVIAIGLIGAKVLKSRKKLAIAPDSID
jgi:hypothetical protein